MLFDCECSVFVWKKKIFHPTYIHIDSTHQALGYFKSFIFLFRFSVSFSDSCTVWNTLWRFSQLRIYEMTRLKTAQQQCKIHRHHQILTNSLLNERRTKQPKIDKYEAQHWDEKKRKNQNKTIKNKSHRNTYFDFVTTTFSRRIRIVQSLLGEIESVKKNDNNKIIVLYELEMKWIKRWKNTVELLLFLTFNAGCWLMSGCWMMNLCVNANKQ